MENEDDKKWAIGIDLGTANISAAVYREAKRQIETIPLDDTDRQRSVAESRPTPTLSTLPAALQPSVQSEFIDAQSVDFIQSKAFQLEKGKQKLVYFYKLDVLGQLDHQPCVSLVGKYSDPKYFALIMQPVGDYNFSQYYDQYHNATDKLSLLRGFFGYLVSAVQYLHDSKMRHRDIKPQNIIVKNDQRPLRPTRAKTVIYAAPEVVRAERRNTAADMWSLGCVFLDMVTVLQGKTVQDMPNYFREQSDSSSFHENAESISVWADRLRGIAQ
ncbi:uncharacterized protein VB005_04757 [Metarhizium brunneum]